MIKWSMNRNELSNANIQSKGQSNQLVQWLLFPILIIIISVLTLKTTAESIIQNAIALLVPDTILKILQHFAFVWTKQQK